MGRKLTAALAVAALCIAIPARAGFEEGWAAYQRGDYATAFGELAPLAEQGHADARNYLGLIHAGGRGVPRDGAEAVRWLREAAGQGHVAAMFNLAVLYYKDEVVSRDYVQAHAWFDLAARRGVGLGETFRAKTARMLTPAGIAEAERLAREWKP